MAKAVKEPADYILPLYISGLEGRMIRMAPPPKSKTELLFIYGHHSNLERYFGIMELMNRYAGITTPDLPGFGGMDAFYKVGEKPTLDNFADYLATFIKWRYKKQRFVVAGYGLGLVILTRMLQKYPELAKQVQLVLSVAGFSHYSDIKISNKQRMLNRGLTKLFSTYVSAAIYKQVFLRPFLLRHYYGRKQKVNQKLSPKDIEKINRSTEAEVALWRRSEPRTHMSMSNLMLKLDLPKYGHIDLPIYHAQMTNDHHLNSVRVEQHLRQIYKDCIIAKVKESSSGKLMFATAEDAKPVVPKQFLNAIKKVK